ncbi:hypothetical protein FOZ60_006752 [Perkinsus olseni]|uniref:Uncharacterized protein n=1 Tax=Perkinsus olseni TaxID=32597 RepID=A0A7J6NN56_PEROL|nr:hypothetical protein FOZ60_006752 [Perkinsus olseni]
MTFLGRACRVASPYRGIFAITRPARGGMGSGFGTSYAHDPKWIEDWMSRKRVGVDRMDWFFRAFNRLRLYELFFKSTPRFYAFMVIGGLLGSYYWSRFWEHYWIRVNKGRLYKDVPYVYPPQEE